MASSRMPAIFVNHGGGPLPLLNKASKLSTHLATVGTKFVGVKPAAIVVFSAHWEESPIKITSGATHELLFDYGGFPKETYEYKYPAKGDPKLAQDILELLTKAQIPAALEPKRGWDHGVFVPLLLMYPDADVPVVSVSLNGNLDPVFHASVGASLASLRDRGVLFLGSGYTFHNMREFFHPTKEVIKASQTFDAWLRKAMATKEESGRRELVAKWKEAPGGVQCHPREEHLIPLFVISGAGGDNPATVIYEEQAPHSISGFSFEK